MREIETAFVGKMIAGVSHELMNVLAIIKERSGLIEDLLALDNTSFPYRDKLTKTLLTIREQVGRGMEISDRVNKFAHTMDESMVRLGIDELLDQLAFLMQRFARLKKVQLKVGPVEPSVLIDTDPFRLQMILAACLEYCLARTASQGVITLQCQHKGKEIAIQCVSEPNSSPKEDVHEFPNLQANLQQALDDLGLRLLPLSGKHQVGLELILPTSK
ncbi:MAG: hypothetical protein KKE57_02605 [Proteobacteria bacterium]|nr:hypothetical protein [Pseudomonadota bacterium]